VFFGLGASYLDISFLENLTEQDPRSINYTSPNPEEFYYFFYLFYREMEKSNIPNKRLAGPWGR